MQAFLLLTQYFTRIPVKQTLDYSSKSMARASYLLSLHSGLMGLIPAVLAYGLNQLHFPFFLNAVFSLVFSILLLGGYHLDGLADTCDGLLSGRSRDRILEIMKDPTMGAYGTMALFFVLLLKSYFLYEMIRRGALWLWPIYPALGKASLSLLAKLGKPAKEHSSANLLLKAMPWGAVLVNGLVVLAAGFFVNRLLLVALALTVVTILISAFNRYCDLKIGGLVGDNLGFASEVAEIVVGICWLCL